MRKNRTSKYCGFAVAALMLAGAGHSIAQTSDLTIQTFDADDTSNNKWGHEWGSGTQAFDGAAGNPPGALLVSSVFSSTSDTPITTYICLNGNPWYVGTAINFSQYKAIEFDIKWDNTSDITVSEFNNVSTIPVTATNQAGQTILNHALDSGSINGLEINLCGGPGGQMAPLIITTNIPEAAANGWVHMVIPIDPTTANLDGASGIVFHKWVNQGSGQIANDFTGRFWIDNVTLQGTAGPPPPPTIARPTPATPGLNVFASTPGLYDRQSAVLRQNYGLSWVGAASEANPVTYAFTIVGYPNSVNCEAWMFLVPQPNPNYLDGAPDWNSTNCAIVYLQGNNDSATMHFQYKVNEPNQQAMYSGGNDGVNYYTNAPGSWDGVTAGYLESGNLGSITNNGILGKWQLKFTSDTNATLIAPNGNSTNVVIPPYNVGYLAESGTPAFRIYLGMQANNADAMSQSVVYSDFSVTGTSSPISENFLTESELDTTNTWDLSGAAGPKGVLIVPSDAAYWVKWTLPDSGFGLDVAPSLSGSTWSSPTLGPIIPLVGQRGELVMKSELPAGGDAFFRLIKRSFSQLQVLFPGETNAPNTLTGKVGTPDPLSLAANYGLIDVTVNAVDSTFHIIHSATDMIHFTSDDPASVMPNDTALANGTLTATMQFGSAGSWTVTASDVTNTNIPPATSSTITVNY